MLLELLIKVPDISEEKLREDKEEKKLERLIKGEIEDELKIDFKYEPYDLDLKDVVMYGRDGKEHTKIYLPFGVMLAKINFSLFKKINEASTGTVVKTIDDLK